MEQFKNNLFVKKKNEWYQLNDLLVQAETITAAQTRNQMRTPPQYWLLTTYPIQIVKKGIRKIHPLSKGLAKGLSGNTSLEFSLNVVIWFLCSCYFVNVLPPKKP